ncbi:hypothetical protein V9K92_14975 [Phyllobacterium sp. CCNWLW109]|uniref:hypothetical protein n=1 Tax=Phyllobacterium sp. CCNWLW109 TaxID=3127479 RepID=UPI00307893E6
MSALELQPIQKIQRAIQLAGFHYIASLKSHPTRADHEITYIDKTYSFEAIKSSNDQQLQVDFQSWAVASVVRDLIESFSIFLWDVYSHAVANNPDGVFSSTPTKFEQRGIEDQLKILTVDFGIDSAWTSILNGYNKARNCLAHRSGIVAAKDATDGNELVIRWLVLSIQTHDGATTQTIPSQGLMENLIQGSHISGIGSHLFINDREKRVAIGNELQFFPDEFFGICQTFQLATAAIAGLSKPLSDKV